MWPFKASLKYVPVESEDGSASSQSRIIGFSLKVLFLATIIAFLAGSGLSYTIASSLNPDIPHELSWSPTLRPKTQWSKFKGKLMEPSEYRGPPSQAVDDAWKRYTWSKWFDGGSVALGVTKEAIEKSRKFTEDEWVNSTTRLDDADGGGYLATLEMFHQLHCLVSKYMIITGRAPGS